MAIRYVDGALSTS